jgi:hypothetical protein
MLPLRATAIKKKKIPTEITSNVRASTKRELFQQLVIPTVVLPTFSPKKFNALDLLLGYYGQLKKFSPK